MCVYIYGSVNMFSNRFIYHLIHTKYVLILFHMYFIPFFFHVLDIYVLIIYNFYFLFLAFFITYIYQVCPYLVPHVFFAVSFRVFRFHLWVFIRLRFHPEPEVHP